MPDLFFSYSHVDKRWVDILAPLLEQHVNQYLGGARPGRLWKDNRLSGNQPYSPEIHAQLNQAHCLLVCLSPAYLYSEWCMRELTEFSRRVGTQTGRIFCIEPDQLPFAHRPALLLKTLGYCFWRQDPVRKLTFPLYPGDPTYERTLTDLSQDIGSQLKIMLRQEPNTPEPVMPEALHALPGLPQPSANQQPLLTFGPTG